MLRNFSSKLILGFKPRKCLNLRLISSDEKYFEDSKLPRYSKEGLPLRDPRDILDPDYEKPVGNVTSENFQFDVKQGIGQSLEEEEDHFKDYVSKYGDARFSENFKYQNREFSVSTAEWNFVERLLPQKLTPLIPNKEKYPSGFEKPKISAEESLEKYGYFVGRTSNFMLPVYVEVLARDNREELRTKVRKVEGNLFQLRQDLDQHLFDLYQRQFIAQVSEIQHQILFLGDFEEEIKEFLLNKGF